MPFVEQDVGRLQDGVVKEAHIDVVLLALALVLELGHATDVTKLRYRVENPTKLGVLWDLALHKKHGAIGIDTASEDVSGHVQDPLLHQLCVVVLGNCVIIHDAEVAKVLLLQGDPVSDRPKVVAQVEFTRRLNA